MATDPIKLRLTDDLAAWLADRAERVAAPASGGQRLKTEVELWRHTLAAELRRQRWTLPELGLIADVLNGALITDAATASLGLVAVEVMDARAGMEGVWGDKWGVDELGLIDKLLRLGPAADQALADAVSRWWTLGADHTGAGWASVGVGAGHA